MIEEQFSIDELLGDVTNYEPMVIEEVEPKEMIGKFPGKITEAELKTGTTNGKGWARVSLRIECQEEGLEGRLAFINMFLGTEPSLYGDQDKSQSEIFLDTIKTAGLEFKDKSAEGFYTSVKKLVGQECWFKSWHKKKKDEKTGKMVPQVNDMGYKVLNQRLIAPQVESSIGSFTESKFAV